MTVTRLSVPEMHCEHCVSAIGTALWPLPGVHKVVVDLERTLVTVDHDQTRASDEALVGALVDLGYEVPTAEPVARS